MRCTAEVEILSVMLMDAIWRFVCCQEWGEVCEHNLRVCQVNSSEIYFLTISMNFIVLLT